MTLTNGSASSLSPSQPQVLVLTIDLEHPKQFLNCIYQPFHRQHRVLANERWVYLGQKRLITRTRWPEMEPMLLANMEEQYISSDFLP